MRIWHLLAALAAVNAGLAYLHPDSRVMHIVSAVSFAVAALAVRSRKESRR
jgi:hypothetical protein